MIPLHFQFKFVNYNTGTLTIDGCVAVYKNFIVDPRVSSVIK